MHPKMFEGYDEKLVKKDDLISDIKESAEMIKAHDKVIESLNENLGDTKYKDEAINTVNNIKISVHEYAFESLVTDYIKDYVLQEISNKIISELGLNSGDMDKHNENKITEVLSEFIKDNI